MKDSCRDCKHWRRSFDGHSNSDLCCHNEDSDMYCVPTMSDDTCDNFEEDNA